jgi:GNAT superfamily N-acetyltransferase
LAGLIGFQRDVFMMSTGTFSSGAGIGIIPGCRAVPILIFLLSHRCRSTLAPLAGDRMTQASSPIIRLAVSADAHLLAEIGARTFSETFAADNTPEDMAAYVSASFNSAQLEAELGDSRSTFLIAEIEGVAVGYARLHAGDVSKGVEGERPIELVRLYVSAEWLGRGIGEALMRACISEARQQGYRTLWLGVWERNSRARAFYRKWAFHEVGKHIFQLGEDRQTDVLMERSV